MARPRIGAVAIALALFAAPIEQVVAAKPAANASDEAEATAARLRALLSPSAREKLDAAASTFAPSTVTKSTKDVKAAANAWARATWPDVGGGDLGALEFIVLMQAAKSATEDVKAIMEAVKAINDAKAQAEERIAEIEAAIATKGGKAKSATKKKKRAKPAPSKTKVGLDIWYAPKLPELASIETMSLVELDAALEKLRDSRDSLAELGEEQQLRADGYTARGGKLMAELSNLLKKIADVGAGILGNLK